MVDVIYEDEIATVSLAVVGNLANNVFFLTCRKTHRSLLIDAATDATTLLTACDELNVRQVVETHGHYDHIGAVPHLRSAGIPVGIAPADAHALAANDFELTDGDVLVVGDLRVRVLATPGHTAGSTCFAVDNTPLLFTGDTLFPGGPGATKSFDSDFPTIIESITRLFRSFDDKTIVLPGHGANTTIGAERPHLQQWTERGY